MQSWTIGRRLAVGFSLLVILVGVLASTFYVTLKRIRVDVIGITENNLPGLVLVNDVLKNTLNYRVLTLRHVASTDIAEMQELDRQCDPLAQQILDALAKYEALPLEPEDRELYKKVGPALQTYRELAQTARTLSLSGQQAEAIALTRGKNSAAYAAFEQTVLALVAYNKDAADRAGTEINNAIRASLTTTITVASAIIALSIAAAIFITLGVHRAIRKVAGSLDDAAAQVSSASGQVSASSQSLAEGASEQAASLEETSASLEEISGMTRSGVIARGDSP